MFYPDISHYHPVIDWKQAKENCGFIISKATEGRTYVDPTLEDFIKGCEENAIPYWLYSFLKKGNEAEQAQFLMDTCEPLIGNCFIGYALDAECQNIDTDVLDAIYVIHNAGHKCLFYHGYSDYTRFETVRMNLPSNCAIWEARWGKNDGVYDDAYPCHTGTSLHQYTSVGRCGGIDGECDLNCIEYGSINNISTDVWLTGTESGVDPYTIEQLAYQVLGAIWGNGSERKARLTEAGYDYDKVQSKVNEILKKVS